jgi:hypothetical protein
MSFPISVRDLSAIRLIDRRAQRSVQSGAITAIDGSKNVMGLTVNS